MKKEIVFMFSGQGSQYLNMGREFYENIPCFRKQMQALDEIPQALLGTSIIDIMYSKKSTLPERFDNILHTHPALFMLQYSVAQCFIREGIAPQWLLGCSLGEFVALAVSGAISAEDAMTALVRQAKLFDERCVPGGMLAVLEHTDLINNQAVIPPDCELAGVNFGSHFCLTGSREALRRAALQLEQRGTIFDYLPVRQPFHSSLIDPLREEFIRSFEGITIGKPQIPMISAMTAGPKETYTAEDIWKVVREPILFYDTLKLFHRSPKNNLHTQLIYLDLGASGTLANFVKYGLNKGKQTDIRSVMSPFGEDLCSYKSLISQLTESVFFKGA